MQQSPIVTDPRFESQDYDSAEPPKQRSWFSTCLIGCGVILGIALVIAIIAGVWVARNWRGWAADLASVGIKQGIDESQLPAAEKLEIKVQVDRVTDAFRSGQLTNEQLTSIIEKLVESPLMTSLIATAADAKYISKSTLSDEEKAEGRRNLRRFVRGMIDGQIAEQELDVVLAHIATRQPNGGWELRAQVSDDDLRKFLDAAKAEADAAGIAEEPADIDPSDEVKKIIDEVMLGPALEAPLAIPAEEAPQIELPDVEAPQNESTSNN